ncbi:MAG: hypothetical protein ACE5HP_02515 [Gemmatimonadota bacterium]
MRSSSPEGYGGDGKAGSGAARARPTESRATSFPRWWRLGIGFIVSSGAFYVLSRTRPDPDLWGHVRFGQLARQLGRIPTSEPYSYLADRWINHEWLSEWLFAFAFDGLGTPGLVVLKVIVGLLTFGLVYRQLVREGLDPLRGGSVAIGVLLLLYIGTDPIRPQLFTFLLFLLLLLALRAAERGELRWLWAVPLLFVPWVNLHGGFLAGLGVLGVWTAARLLEAGARGERLGSMLRFGGPGALVTVLSLGACLVNPYGIRLLRFLLRTATVARPEITEWRPIEIGSIEGAMYLGFLGLLGWSVGKSDHRRCLPSLTVLGLTALLPLFAVRHLPLFGLSGAVLGAPHLASALRREPTELPTGAGARMHRTAAALGGTFGILLLGISVPNFRCIRLGPPLSSDYPARAVGFLGESGVGGNLAVFFDWGEYAIWHLGPRVQVSMDGRRETVYADSAYRENFRFLYGTGRWDALLEDRPTHMALVPKNYAVFNLLRLKPGWELVYEDSMTAVFGRAGSEQLEGLRATEPPDLPVDGSGLCFP